MNVKLDWYVQIDDYKLMLVDSIKIVNSTEMLADTCILSLPSATLNKAENIEQFVKRGSRVIVKAGYDGQLVTEFEGYVLKVHIKQDGIEIECEDDLFLLRKAIANKSFGIVSLKELVAYCLQSVQLNWPIVTDFEFTYEKYVVQDSTAYEVLKKIQEDVKANVYAKNNEIHIHAAYTENFGTVEYDLSKNVEKADIEYLGNEDKKLQIEISCTNSKGDILKAVVGSFGGEKIVINKGSHYNQAGLNAIAIEELKKEKLGGYQGSITAWLIPYVQSGYSIKIIDDDYTDKNGTYYAKKVETTISESGGERKVEIGKKLSNEQ